MVQSIALIGMPGGGKSTVGRQLARRLDWPFVDSDALIEQRRNEALDYQEYLRKIVELTRKITSPEVSGAYPATMNTRGKRALYDNLRRDEELALRGR